jgi:uncharacterized protein
MGKRVVVISGGSDGLGAAVAKQCCNAGDIVVILARSEKDMQTMHESCGCDYVVCDVSDAQMCDSAVKSIFKKHGRIDVLVNNAGIFCEGLLEKQSVEQIESVIGVNTLGTIFLTRAVLPEMKRAGKGDICNIISIAGKTAKSDRTIYNSSKWAVTGFTAVLRKELIGTGIRVIGINPGKFESHIFEKAGVKKDMSNAMSAEEVAAAVCFALDQPPHIEIKDITLRHVDQV